MWEPKKYDIVAVSDNKKFWLPAVYLKTTEIGTIEAKLVGNYLSCHWNYCEQFDKHFAIVRYDSPEFVEM